MSVLITALIGIVAVVLQGSALSLFSVWGAQIDIVLLIILSMTLIEQTQTPVIFAMVFGALTDILYSPQVGFFALAYAACAGVAVYSLKQLPRINMATVILTGLAGSLIAQGICLLAAYVIGARFNLPEMFKAHILPQAVLTAALMLPVYYLAGRFSRRGYSR